MLWLVYMVSVYIMHSLYVSSVCISAAWILCCYQSLPPNFEHRFYGDVPQAELARSAFMFLASRSVTACIPGTLFLRNVHVTLYRHNNLMFGRISASRVTLAIAHTLVVEFRTYRSSKCIHTAEYEHDYLFVGMNHRILQS